MNHKGTLELGTDRLTLRRFTLEDTEPMFRNWANDERVTKFLTWPPHGTLKVTRRVIEEWISRYEDLSFYQWAIVLKEEGSEPIGTISTVNMDESVYSFEIGYCIGVKWWGRGITSETLSAVVDFLFKEVNANRIESRHDPKNPNSGRVMEKCGFRYEGLSCQADRNNQGICDYVRRAILAEDYQL